MLQSNNYNVLLQLEHVAGDNHPIARIVLTAHKVFELGLEVDTSGHYRKALATYKLGSASQRVLQQSESNTALVSGQTRAAIRGLNDTGSSLTTSPDFSTIPPTECFPCTNIPLIYVI